MGPGLRVSTAAWAMAGATVALAAFHWVAAPRAPGGDVPEAGFFKGPRVDVHTHISPVRAEDAVQLMDRFGIDVAVILSAAPPGPEWLRIQRAAAQSDGRLIAFAGMAWAALRYPDRLGELLAAGVHEAHRLGARGIKIPKALGLALPDPDGGLLAVDDPRLAPAFDAAGALGLPVAIHVGDPVAFWQPVDEHNERFAELSLHPGWSYADKDVPSHRALFDAQRRLFARHPNTTFIAVHVAGFPENLDEVDALLNACDNVVVDIAARVPEIGRVPPAVGRAFFLRHQDRILFGTDFGLYPTSMMLGSPLAWPETDRDLSHFFRATWRYLETGTRDFAHPTPIQGDWPISGIDLPDEVLHKVYWDNAARVLGL